MQFLHQLPDEVLIIMVRIGRIGEQTGLCQIGQDHIGHTAKFCHGLNVAIIKSGIEFSMIGHGRICDQLSSGRDNRSADPHGLIDQGNTAQVSGIERLERNALGVPMACGIGDEFRKALNGGFAKTSGVGGQYSRGENTGFHAAECQDGQGHGHGALTYAGDILHGEDPLVVHGHVPQDIRWFRFRAVRMEMASRGAQAMATAALKAVAGSLSTTAQMA